MLSKKTDKKIKILYFVDRINRGGIQILLYNWIEKIDKSKFDISLLYLDDGKYHDFEQNFKKLQCNMYKLENIWIRTPFDYIKMKKSLKEFFSSNNDFDIVHYNSSSKNYLVLKQAFQNGVPVRIAHSHSSDFSTNNILKKIYGNFLKKKILKYANHYFACSEVAGKWLYGNKVYDLSNFVILPNAVDYSKFSFNDDIRKEYRKKLEIKDKEVVLGCVGRFSTVKNHEFLINLFNEYHKLKPNFKLLLIGDGELINKIKDLVKKYSLEDSVIFTGAVNNVYVYYNVMDALLMPSLYEGLPVTLVEAQCNGLNCIVSNNISREADLTGTIKYLSLDDNDLWTNTLNNIKYDRNNNYKKLKEKKYLLDESIIDLQNMYINYLQNRK